MREVLSTFPAKRNPQFWTRVQSLVGKRVAGESARGREDTAGFCFCFERSRRQPAAGFDTPRVGARPLGAVERFKRMLRRAAVGPEGTQRDPGIRA